MRYLVYIGLLCSLFASCKPYASTTLKPNEMTYQDFRAQQSSFQSNDGTIKYIDQGQGPVILLLHGVPTSGWLYRHMIDQLAKTNRVIAPDVGFWK